ncbi:MAG: DUF1127 domain-containing protein [Alphaproteobacteria bacterium]|nr:DUF1127 domain-containing protein [Alphaproteobacteria bacterium]
MCNRSPVSVGADRAGWLMRHILMLSAWADRARQRRALLALDARALRDLGLSSADVAGEAAKPFWRG